MQYIAQIIEGVATLLVAIGATVVLIKIGAFVDEMSAKMRE